MPTSSSPSRLRIWIMAARPRTLPAAAAPVLIGGGLGVHHGVFRPLPVLAALVGALLILVATNLANDYYDFVRGSDTDDRVGPTRVTQAGLMAPSTVRSGMIVTLAAALVVGIYLVAVGGWPIVVVGLASLACAVAYTGGPFPLAYHGLGDLFVFVFFGLVAVGGTYWVQAMHLPADALWAGAGVGALSTAILAVNNLRDIPTDEAAGKRTLAVRLGRRGTQLEYGALLLLGLTVPPLGHLAFGWPRAVFLSLVVVLALAAPLGRVLTFLHPVELLPALGETARAVALYGLLLAAALALG